jgi:hypothetical protein
MPKEKLNPYCYNCMFWVFVYEDADKKFGTCDNIFATESIRCVEKEDFIEDNTIFTESLFGCIYHENGDDFLTEININK